MKLPSTIALGALFASGILDTSLAQSTQHHHSHRQFVFVIDIDYRNSQEAVEQPSNWRYLGDVTDNIPYCEPGIRQACQLIVDECDTELSPSDHKSRILKSDVLIITSLNKKASTWYVSDYIPHENSFYEILNEEDEE